jgi:DNA-binding CsgD family transcriptional regulator
MSALGGKRTLAREHKSGAHLLALRPNVHQWYRATPREEVKLVAHDVGKLTARERQVLGLLARGYDIKSAAKELSISTSAVGDRLRQARRKLEVSSSREAARILVAHESNGSFDVHRFSGVPYGPIPGQLNRFGIFAKNGVVMTMLIAAAAFISTIAIDHSTSNSASARNRPVDCRAFASAHSKGPTLRSGRNVHFDTSVTGKRTAPLSDKKKAEFCIAY